MPYGSICSSRNQQHRNLGPSLGSLLNESDLSFPIRRIAKDSLVRPVLPQCLIFDCPVSGQQSVLFRRSRINCKPELFVKRVEDLRRGLPIMALRLEQ